MSLNEFLGDAPKASSWADDIEGLPKNMPLSRETGANCWDNKLADETKRDWSLKSTRNVSLDTFSRSGSRSTQSSGRPSLTLPEYPPFTARINNLTYETTEDEISKFFSKLQIENLRIIKDRDSVRSAGYCFVDFKDLKDLEEALGYSGSLLNGREIRVTVSEARRNRNIHSNTKLDWASARNSQASLPPPPPPSFREKTTRHTRSSSEFDHNPAAPSAANIDWSKREGPLPARNDAFRRSLKSPLRTMSSDKPKSNPFGDAKPVDDSKILAKAEEKLQQHRKALAEQGDKEFSQPDKSKRKNRKIVSKTRGFGRKEKPIESTKPKQEQTEQVEQIEQPDNNIQESTSENEATTVVRDEIEPRDAEEGWTKVCRN